MYVTFYHLEDTLAYAYLPWEKNFQLEMHEIWKKKNVCCNSKTLFWMWLRASLNKGSHNLKELGEAVDDL